MKSRDWFSRFATWAAAMSGHPYTFLIGVLICIVWAVTGPMFRFNDAWQLIINTGTNIATFLMVFLIQNTQNRDSLAAQVKLDELIRAVKGAHNVVINLEDLSDEELAAFRERYARIAEKAREAARNGHRDTGSPLVEVPVDKEEAPKAEGTPQEE